MAKPSVSLPIIVEGKYDKIKLDSVIDATVITTEGFGVFKSAEKKLLIRRLAENGIIVLTDSDGGGLVIRNYLSSILHRDKVINLYIPQIKGKERRKTEVSKEGLLGVEGVDTELILKIFEPFFGDKFKKHESSRKLTKADLYEDGFSGGQGSRERRERLCREAGLPANIGANALIAALDLLYGYEGYKELISKI